MAAAASSSHAGASTPGMTTPTAVASTPGGAQAPALRVATWNVGIAQENSFHAGNRIAGILDQLVDHVDDLLQEVSFVALNEIHAAHQGPLNSRLANLLNVAFIGFSCGDAIIWRP